MSNNGISLNLGNIFADRLEEEAKKNGWTKEEKEKAAQQFYNNISEAQSSLKGCVSYGENFHWAITNHIEFDDDLYERLSLLSDKTGYEIEVYKRLVQQEDGIYLYTTAKSEDKHTDLCAKQLCEIWADPVKVCIKSDCWEMLQEDIEKM